MSRPSTHVVLTFDDGYWAPAYAAARSLALSSAEPEALVLHLLHSGLSVAHRTELDALASEFPLRLSHLDLEAQPAFVEFAAALPVHRPFTAVIYARLLLDVLLPAEVERLVYLDCDILVRSPIEVLSASDLMGRSIGAVLDPHRHIHMLGTDLTRNADVFSFGFAYFNSGVLLIDRAAFARADVPAKTRELAGRGLLDRLQYDQAALNLIFRDDWLPLDFRWNLINPMQAHEVLEPHIVHYTGPRKPWGLLPGAAFHRHYRHAMTNRIFNQFRRERRGKLLSLFGAGR